MSTSIPLSTPLRESTPAQPASRGESLESVARLLLRVEAQLRQHLADHEQQATHAGV
jgi:hypothetical protein